MDNGHNSRRGKPVLSNIPSLVCAFSSAATTGGTSYAFGLYAAALKKSLSLTQGQLDSISTAFFVAGLFSWIPGLCADRYGCKVAISMGGFCGAAVLMLYWAVAKQFIDVPHSLLVVVLSTLGILIFLSCALVTGAVFKTIVGMTGPGSRGSAVGAAKGYVGLGAGLYACLFGSFQTPGESELDFLPMAAFFFITCASLPALLLLPSKEAMDRSEISDEATPRHFHTLYASLLIMGGLIVVTSMLDLYSSVQIEAGAVSLEETQNDTQLSRALLLIAIWLGPIFALQFLPTKVQDTATSTGLMRIPTSEDEDDGIKLSRQECQDDSTNDDEMPSATIEEDEAEQHQLLNSSSDTAPIQQPEQSQDLNLAQMLQTSSAWLMLWTTTILVGAGTVLTNNMGQMVESLGFPDTVTAASLALFSVAQAMGRVMTGSVSEAMIKYTPRPLFLVFASVLGFVSHGLLGVATSEIVFVAGATLAGIAFGMVWPLMVLITGEVFGPANVGANYMFYDGFTSAAGTLLLTKIIAQDVYESHINPDSEDQTTCVGMACFQDTHMAVAGFSLTCIVTSWAMLYTTRHIYSASGTLRSAH